MSPVDAATIVVHEPFRRGVPPLGPYFRQLWQRRQFVVHLARSELKAEHYNTAFGQLWNIINPLLLAAVYFLLLGVIKKGGPDRGSAEFMARLITGIFFFYFTRHSAQGGASSVVSGERLILNTAFPRALLPITAVIGAFLQFLPTLPIILALYLALGQPLHMSMTLLPLLAVILTVFNLGLALFLSAATVYFRDTKVFLPYVLRIWLYLTPILYSPAEVPESVAPFLKINPLYYPFAALQGILAGDWPTATQLLASGGWAVAVAVAGALFFVSRERELVTRL